MLRFYSSIALLVFCLTGCVDKSRDIASPLPDSGGTDTPADTDGESSSATFDRAALMVNLVDNIFIPNYQATATLANTFSADSGSLATYCASIGTADEATSLSAAQTGWSTLMDSVQKTEMHVVGPALRNDEALQNEYIHTLLVVWRPAGLIRLLSHPLTTAFKCPTVHLINVVWPPLSISYSIAI